MCIWWYEISPDVFLWYCDIRISWPKTDYWEPCFASVCITWINRNIPIIIFYWNLFEKYQLLGASCIKWRKKKEKVNGNRFHACLDNLTIKITIISMTRKYAIV